MDDHPDDDKDKKIISSRFVSRCNKTPCYITEPWDNLHHRRPLPRLNRVHLAQVSHPSYKVSHVKGPIQKGHSLISIPVAPIEWNQRSIDSRYTLLLELCTHLETMVRDFQNQALQNEWNSFRSSVLNHRAERQQNLAHQNGALLQERQKRAAEVAYRQAALDNRLDTLNAKFSDISVALEYDTARVQEKFGEQKLDNPEKEVQHCLGERVHWMFCQQKYADDGRPCNAYLNALEQCVSKTIVDSTAE